MAEKYNMNLKHVYDVSNDNRNRKNLYFNDKNEIVDGNCMNYVDIAKKIVENDLKRNKFNKLELTTSQIRNLLSLLAEIYKNVVVSENDKLNDDLIANIQYFRLKCVYQAGRDAKVNDFVKNAKLLELINLIDDNKKRFINFYHYMEALVAWHKFNGGED